MKIAVLGLGYVGLANVAYFADSRSHFVVAYDTDEAKVEGFQHNLFVLKENALNDQLKKDAKRILYTTKKDDLKDCELFVIAVGTPSQEDGKADLSYFQSALDTLRSLNEKPRLLIRSTVPVGTAKQVQATFPGASVISMPEFLAEGRSYEDETNPYRLVIGARSQAEYQFILNLRKSDLKSGIPCYLMSNESAELTKYASNIFLSTKISFINEMSRLADSVGADIVDVANAMGADPRIGHAMLKAGVGYGGSCFPKDGKALLALASEEDVTMLLPEATEAINLSQPLYFLKKILAEFPSLKGVKIALLGLSYKAGTGDIRYSIALSMAKYLSEGGAILSAYDPVEIARKAFQEAEPNVAVKTSLSDAVKGTSALLILTEAREFSHLDEKALLPLMEGRIIFDGRNLYPTHHFQYFTYVSVGRAKVKAKD
jgi:UDPglucose 6-dehydrogenase